MNINFSSDEQNHNHLIARKMGNIESLEKLRQEKEWEQAVTQATTVTRSSTLIRIDNQRRAEEEQMIKGSNELKTHLVILVTRAIKELKTVNSAIRINFRNRCMPSYCGISTANLICGKVTKVVPAPTPPAPPASSPAPLAPTNPTPIIPTPIFSLPTPLESKSEMKLETTDLAKLLTKKMIEIGFTEETKIDDLPLGPSLGPSLGPEPSPETKLQARLVGYPHPLLPGICYDRSAWHSRGLLTNEEELSDYFGKRGFKLLFVVDEKNGSPESILVSFDGEPTVSTDSLSLAFDCCCCCEPMAELSLPL